MNKKWVLSLLIVVALLMVLSTSMTAIDYGQQDIIAQTEQQQDIGEEIQDIFTLLSTTDNKSKSFYVFTENVNETALGIPLDHYTLKQIIVNRGDNVTIHFYNTGESERHTFTIDAPYNINRELAGGENSTIRFNADREGIFEYYSIYHLPTMTGQLVVLP